MRNWSVGVRSMLAGLQHGRFTSLEEIDVAIKEAEQELVDARQHMRDLYLKKAVCLHAYRASTYSIQRRLMGFVRVNERVCESCSHIELQTEDDDCKNRPDWAKDAHETYYNNNI